MGLTKISGEIIQTPLNVGVVTASSIGIGTTNPSGAFQVGAATSQSVTITSTGSIGIGTTNPSTPLHLRVSSNNGIRIDADSGYPAVWWSQSGTDKWSITSNLNNDNALVIRESGVENRVAILTGGNVGVGTTIPRAKLHVLGDSILTRVGVATTSANTNLDLGKTYIYYSSVTLTLPASPTVGDRVEVINRSNTTTAVLARNGSNIMGLAENLDLDVLDGAFTITYSNATDGWVIGR